MEIHQFKFVPSDSAVAPPLEGRGKRKRQKFDAVVPVLQPRERENEALSCEVQREHDEKLNQLSGEVEPEAKQLRVSAPPPLATESEPERAPDYPKFGMTSVCGRRRDMEDAIAIHPSFSGQNPNFPNGMHFFGVYDGHGCSHVSFASCLG